MVGPQLLDRLKGQFSAISYILIFLVVGLPVWWKTTEVYRAVLPYDEIHALSDVKTVVQRVNVLLVSPEAVDRRASELQKLLSNSKIYDIKLTIQNPGASDSKKLESCRTLEELDQMIATQVYSNMEGWIVLYEVGVELLENWSPVTVGNHRTVFFSPFSSSEDVAAMVMDTVLGEYYMLDMWESSSLPLSRGYDTLRKKSVGKIDLQLTLIIPEPEYVSASWNIQDSVKNYLQPFIDQFPLEVKINSQVLYLTTLNIPGSLEGQGPLEVSGDELGTSLNKVESLLSSQSSSHPALNLVVYIPPIHRSPLTIAGSTSNSFILPRWGGVTIYNFNKEDENVKFPVDLAVDMERVMGVWLGQLRSLLGVRPVTTALPLPSLGIRGWEVDYQLRYRSQENLVETRSTLQSLSSLLSQISNIVITEDIARRVETALESFSRSIVDLNAGEIVAGHSASQTSLKQSEAAFFDPSLLALLYFPDDQKYAIYVPYFLPVGLPILLSIKSIINIIKNKEKTD